MTGDPVKRAYRLLPPGAPRQTQLGPPLNYGTNPLAKARELINNQPPQTVRKPGPELAHLDMTCGASSASYIVIAERLRDHLLVVGYELPQARRQGGSSPPALLSGEYKLEFPDGWACPLCGTGETWLCSCTDFYRALHCHGNLGGKYHCACGRFEERAFVKAPEKIQVRGSSVAASQGEEHFQRGQSQLKQVLYEPNR